MNRRRIALVGVMATLSFLVIITFVAWANRGKKDEDGFPVKILEAVRRFRNERLKGQPLPAEVSLDTLISAKYLRSEDVRGFKGVQVTVMPPIPGDRPESIRLQGSLPGGTFYSVVTEDSVPAPQR